MNQSLINTEQDLKEAREKLLQKDHHVLVDALLSLAVRDERAEAVVESIIATEEEAVKAYKKRLSAIKRRKAFIDWRGASSFAADLENMLTNLKKGVSDPVMGMKLVGDFFKADDRIFNACDDSSGDLGYVFSHMAADIFAQYAKKCPDSSLIMNTVLDLIEDDDYGVRDALIHEAHQYLSEQMIRQLIDRLHTKKSTLSKKDKRSLCLYYIEDLAKQIKDANLFEKIRIEINGATDVNSCVEIATVYFDAGQIEKALGWLNNIPQEASYMVHERDALFLKIYKELGNHDQLEQTAKRIFKRTRNIEDLKTLLNYIGQDKRDQTVNGEIEQIFKVKTFESNDVKFLLDTENTDHASKYIVDRASVINGDNYYSLLPLAENMEKQDYSLAAYVIYRALLESILARAVSKYYHHGVRYLKKLENLAGQIDDWKKIQTHSDYFAELRMKHARKSSFWSKYRGDY